MIPPSGSFTGIETWQTKLRRWRSSSPSMPPEKLMGSGVFHASVVRSSTKQLGRALARSAEASFQKRSQRVVTFSVCDDEAARYTIYSEEWPTSSRTAIGFELDAELGALGIALGFRPSAACCRSRKSGPLVRLADIIAQCREGASSIFTLVSY